MSEKKKIAIQAYWGADVNTTKGSAKLSMEEVMKRRPIVICSVIIDGEVVGHVTWDGKRLAIKEEKKVKKMKCPACGSNKISKYPWGYVCNECGNTWKKYL